MKVSDFSRVQTVLAIAKVLAIILVYVFAVFAIFGIMTNPVGLSALKPEVAEKSAMIGVGSINVLIIAGEMSGLTADEVVRYEGEYKFRQRVPPFSPSVRLHALAMNPQLCQTNNI